MSEQKPTAVPYGTSIFPKTQSGAAGATPFAAFSKTQSGAAGTAPFAGTSIVDNLGNSQPARTSPFSFLPAPEDNPNGKPSTASPVDPGKSSSFFKLPCPTEQTKPSCPPVPATASRKHTLDGRDKSGTTDVPASTKANMASTTIHLFDQIEKLATVYKNIPARFQAALTKLIDLKLLFLRSVAYTNDHVDDQVLDELQRSSNIKAKLEEVGVHSQNIDSLIGEKVRVLLMLNGLHDVLASI